MFVNILKRKKHSKLRTVISKSKAQLFKSVAIFRWLPNYTKNDILADLIAGLTVGLTMIPQSIAYAGLAEQPAEYGLYTAFVGSYVYIIFGTIKEVSIGPTSLMSLLTVSYTIGKPVEYVVLLTFLAGCVELFMGLLNLGFVVDFISPCLTSGFTSATSIIIITAQLKNLFGINIKSHNVRQILKEFVQKVDQIKLADTVMGFSCIIFLLIFKYITTAIKPKNPTLKKFLWLMSISKNAITVTLATIVSMYYSQSGVPPFKITGTVPTGIPEVKFPSLTAQSGNQTIGYTDMLADLGAGIAVVPFVAVLANVAIAKAYSINTVVDASQEMMALGLCNILGSFVRAMPSTGAFTRSAVASHSDVRTPFQGLYSGTVIVFALSLMAPYFYYIPKAVLAAVLITAVSSLLDYKILPILWKCNKVDLFLTVGTFIIGTFFGVEAALVLGSILNLLILLKMWSRPKINTDVKEIIETQMKYLYLKPELGLYYPGADYLAECIKKNRNEYPSLPIVLDCSNFLRLDYSAAKTLINILRIFNSNKTVFVMINVEDNILNTMKTIPNSKSVLRFCNKTKSIPEVIVVNEEEENEEDLLLKLNRDMKSIEKSLEILQMLEIDNSRSSSTCSLGTTSTKSPVSENTRKFSVRSLK
ncbi:sodium-independent sulfate anion transporter-like isoform X1 [Diabrotica virgifera virgifera]|uniref:SLC26A/SulP transporter domain-containing protein n=2 Tax=Diabrotica virgifera virgifera TaxID=50390 RepID=A0ABM5KIA3_DIAVI|nr:sodium-independent sulfate anion transporter-like isoform X1 [Diabrotica virgifera virgifera]